MTIWVVGCNGYIGRSMVEYFEEREYDVRGIHRGSNLPVAFKYSDVIINAACKGWKDGDEDPTEVVESNILLPMELDKRRNGSVMIHLSSGIELVQHDHFYAMTKGVASRMLKDKAHVLYLYTVWGGKHVQMTRFMSSLMKACAKNEPYVVTSPYHTRDFVHIDKLCALVESRIYDRDYRDTHIGTGRAVAFYEVVNALEEIAGGQFPNLRIDDSDQSIFLYNSPERTVADTLVEDMRKEWEIASRP